MSDLPPRPDDMHDLPADDARYAPPRPVDADPPAAPDDDAGVPPPATPYQRVAPEVDDRYAPPDEHDDLLPEPVPFTRGDDHDDGGEARVESTLDGAAVTTPEQAYPPAPPDVDAALAAVGRLDDVFAEEEAAAMAARRRELAERELRERPFPRPKAFRLARGSAESVIPGLVLVALGTLLAVNAYAPGTLDLPLALGPVAVMGLTVALLVGGWLAAGRWARGVLLVGLGVLLALGVALALSVGLLRPFAESLADGWPLLLVAGGVAALLSGLVGQPRAPRLAVPGLALALVGGGLFALTAGLLPPTTPDVARQAWPYLLGALALLALLPLLPTRRPARARRRRASS